ncbi:MAG: hypothetical protein ACLFOY_07950 [Desulfatibacillaceae bacterium]
MKKTFVAAMVMAVAILMAAPAMALDFSSDGYFRVRGFYNSHPLLLEEVEPNANSTLDQDDDSDAWMDQRLRVNSKLTVMKGLDVLTRFRACNGYWGDGGAKENVMQWKRVWMSITTPVGLFDVGRMSAFAWGTLFVDSEDSADRIKWTLPLADQFFLIAIFQKNTELDAEYFGVDNANDADSDTYYLAGVYRSEMLNAGLLGAYTNHKTESENQWQPNPLNPGFNLDPQFSADIFAFLPYFKFNMGNFRMQGELAYKWGSVDFERDNQFAMAQPVNGGIPDYDIDALAWNLEAGFDHSMFGAEIGYAWVSGDTTQTDDELSAYGGVGADWCKLYILTDTNNDLYTNLGTTGNLAGAGNADTLGQIGADYFDTNWGVNPTYNPGNTGSKIFYLGGYFKPMESLKLGLIYGNAKAEQTPTINGVSWSQDYGNEIDFVLEWAMFDNLNYTFIAAYLDAGDYFADAAFYNNSVVGAASSADVQLENNITLAHELKLTF